MAFALEHFPTFPYPPSGMQGVEEVERYLTSLHRSMQEFFSLLPRDIKDGISVVDLDDLANTTLADPNADRIVFWDDGAGVYTWLTANTGLAISTTNLNLSHLGLEALTDPGADRIFFWDDGETASKWLAPNDFLTISGTNLNVDYVDEDDMASNSATLLPTQQSVKAYIDNSIHSIIEQYLTDTADGDVVTYLVMDNIETGQVESTAVLEDMGTGDNQLIEEWVTPLGGLGAHTLVTGVYDLHIHAERTDGGRTVQLYWELWTRTSGGAETKRGTSEVTSAVTSKESFDPHIVISTDVDLNTTDRIVAKLYANVSSTPANDTDITIYMEGNVESHLRMPTPFSTISNIFVRHDLATAANDFLVASGSGVYVKKTLAETGAILEGDLQHDNLQGITANEHIDWTGASDNFNTSGTLESGKLTVNAGVDQSIIIKGTSTGNANIGWIGFYDSDGTTRRGHIGDGSVNDDDIYIGADTGYLRLTAAGYISLGTHTYFPDDVVMSFGASLDYSVGYAQATDTLQIVNGTTLGSNIRLKLDSSGHFDFGAGNLTTTGTLGCGVLTSGNIIIPDAGNIGSVSDTDAIAIAAGGEVTLSQTLILSDVVNASTDTDKFLVLDGSNNVDFRTGANVASDIQGSIDHGSIAGLNDEDHSAYTAHSLADAVSDFLVASGANTFVKKTLAETGAILEADLDHGNLQGLSTGADHSYINQDVQTTASPVFLNLQVGGVLTVTGGSKLEIQSGTDGTNAKGIFIWDAGDSAWGIYMGQAGASKSLADGTACTNLAGDTLHHVRFRVNALAGRGFIWENSSEAWLMDLESDTGNLSILGSFFIPNMKAGANQGAASAAAGELWRDTADNSVKLGV